MKTGCFIVGYQYIYRFYTVQITGSKMQEQHPQEYKNCEAKTPLIQHIFSQRVWLFFNR